MTNRDRTLTGMSPWLDAIKRKSRGVVAKELLYHCQLRCSFVIEGTAMHLTKFCSFGRYNC